MSLTFSRLTLPCVMTAAQPKPKKQKQLHTVSPLQLKIILFKIVLESTFRKSLLLLFQRCLCRSTGQLSVTGLPRTFSSWPGKVTTCLFPRKRLQVAAFLWKKQHRLFLILSLWSESEPLVHLQGYLLLQSVPPTELHLLMKCPHKPSIFWPRQEAKLFYPLTLKNCIHKVPPI